MSGSSDKSACSRCRFPGSCPLAAIPGLLADTSGLFEWRYYGRHYVVFRQNQPASGVMLVHSGWLKLFFVGAGGKRVSAGVVGPGSVLGVGEIVSETGYVVSAETGEETELEFLAANHLRDCLKGNPALAVELLQVVVQQTRSFLSQFMGCGVVPADRRLWKMLVDLSKSAGYAHSGSEIKLQISIQDLSDQIGCSRQWTSKLLSDLEDKGWIRRTAGWIILRGDRAKRGSSKSRKVTGLSSANAAANY